MLSTDDKKTKVVPYCGPKEKQTIQFNESGQPHYSSNLPFGYTKYIIENIHQDISYVTGNEACTVVVVNKARKLRFTYTGVSSTTNRVFDPVGITSNRQGRVLISDWSNCIVHILEQDGQFLRYIDICNLRHPYGICVDSRDNLLVFETGTNKVKKIQYFK